MKLKNIAFQTIILFILFNLLVQGNFTGKDTTYIAGYVSGRLIFALIIATFIEFVGYQVRKNKK
jgi:hypothetical protein